MHSAPALQRPWPNHLRHNPCLGRRRSAVTGTQSAGSLIRTTHEATQDNKAPCTRPKRRAWISRKSPGAWQAQIEIDAGDTDRARRIPHEADRVVVGSCRAERFTAPLHRCLQKVCGIDGRGSIHCPSRGRPRSPRGRLPPAVRELLSARRASDHRRNAMDGIFQLVLVAWPVMNFIVFKCDKTVENSFEGVYGVLKTADARGAGEVP